MNAPNKQEMLDDRQGVSYDAVAVELVLAGLRTIQGEFNAAKARGLFSKGRQLVEVVHDPSWTSPALLDERQLADFMELTHSSSPDDVLRAVWYILDVIADEPRLMPALVICRETGYTEVRLTL